MGNYEQGVGRNMSGYFLQRKQILRGEVEKDCPELLQYGGTPVNSRTK